MSTFFKVVPTQTVVLSSIPSLAANAVSNTNTSYTVPAGRIALCQCFGFLGFQQYFALGIGPSTSSCAWPTTNNRIFTGDGAFSYCNTYVDNTTVPSVPSGVTMLSEGMTLRAMAVAQSAVGAGNVFAIAVTEIQIQTAV